MSRNSDSLHKSRSAAPGWQGARSAHAGSIREYVSDEQRSQPRRPQRGSRVGVEEDAPPGNYVTNHCYGTLASRLLATKHTKLTERTKTNIVGDFVLFALFVPFVFQLFFVGSVRLPWERCS